MSASLDMFDRRHVTHEVTTNIPGNIPTTGPCKLCKSYAGTAVYPEYKGRCEICRVGREIIKQGDQWVCMRCIDLADAIGQREQDRRENAP